MSSSNSFYWQLLLTDDERKKNLEILINDFTSKEKIDLTNFQKLKQFGIVLEEKCFKECLTKENYFQRLKYLFSVFKFQLLIQKLKNSQQEMQRQYLVKEQQLKQEHHQFQKNQLQQESSLKEQLSIMTKDNSNFNSEVIARQKLESFKCRMREVENSLLQGHQMQLYNFLNTVNMNEKTTTTQIEQLTETMNKYILNQPTEYISSLNDSPSFMNISNESLHSKNQLKDYLNLNCLPRNEESLKNTTATIPSISNSIFSSQIPLSDHENVPEKSTFDPSIFHLINNSSSSIEKNCSVDSTLTPSPYKSQTFAYSNTEPSNTMGSMSNFSLFDSKLNSFCNADYAEDIELEFNKFSSPLLQNLDKTKAVDTMSKEEIEEYWKTIDELQKFIEPLEQLLTIVSHSSGLKLQHYIEILKTSREKNQPKIKLSRLNMIKKTLEGHQHIQQYMTQYYKTLQNTKDPNIEDLVKKSNINCKESSSHDEKSSLNEQPLINRRDSDRIYPSSQTKTILDPIGIGATSSSPLVGNELDKNTREPLIPMSFLEKVESSYLNTLTQIINSNSSVETLVTKRDNIKHKKNPLFMNYKYDERVVNQLSDGITLRQWMPFIINELRELEVLYSFEPSIEEISYNSKENVFFFTINVIPLMNVKNIIDKKDKTHQNIQSEHLNLDSSKIPSILIRLRPEYPLTSPEINLQSFVQNNPVLLKIQRQFTSLLTLQSQRFTLLYAMKLLFHVIRDSLLIKKSL